MGTLHLILDKYDGHLQKRTVEVNNIVDVKDQLQPYFDKFGSAGSEDVNGYSLYIFDNGAADLTAYVEDDGHSYDILAYEDKCQYEDSYDTQEYYTEEWAQDERFFLTSGENLTWIVSDAENGIDIEFREGLFNETQVVKTSRNLNGDTMKLATIMREIGDWMAETYSVLAVCNWKCRLSAIRKLDNENYWLIMAAATQDLLETGEEQCFSSNRLNTEVCDWLEQVKSVDLTKDEEANLKSVLATLTDEEACEVFHVLHLYWFFHSDDYEMFQWAIDVTCWPAWLPNELKMQDECEEDDIIDEE